MSSEAVVQLVVQGGMTGLVGWLFYHVLTVQIPDLIKQHRASLAEQLATFHAEMHAFRDERKAEQKGYLEALKALTIAVERQTSRIDRIEVHLSQHHPFEGE